MLFPSLGFTLCYSSSSPIPQKSSYFFTAVSPFAVFYLDKGYGTHG